MTKSKNIKIVISAGGTGGHIYPAIAVADVIKSRHPQADIRFVGADGRMEMEKVPKAGYHIVGLPITGIQRRLTFKNIIANLLFPFRLLKSMGMASKLLKAVKPDAVIGFGGFASGPVLKKATALNIPAVIQEQNSFAGKTNKWVAGKVQSICVAYDGMGKFFPADKIVNTGNPVRKDILEAGNKKAAGLAHFKLSEDKKTLLIIGGSLGARTLNHSIDAGLDKLMKAGYQVIWQTGKWYAQESKERVKGLESKGVYAYEFIYDMDLAYAVADVVISRAGALSISELCLVGKPAILVPSPNVSEDHQTKNALSLATKDAALMVTDADAGNTLVDVAIALLADDAAQASLSENIKLLGKPNAAEDIANEVLKLIEK